MHGSDQSTVSKDAMGVTSLIQSDFGYLAGTYPMAVMHQRLPAAKFVGVTIILWGTTTAVTAACHTYAQLMGVRL